MTPELETALEAQLLAMADDELILAHRNSEWTGHAPILEEDIAFTNIALDELGHAQIWYGLYQEQTGANPDRLIFFREPAAFRNVRFVELPRGDWAFSLVRQYLFDTFEAVRTERLLEAAYRPLAEAAAKIRPEEQYHYRHTHTWLRRLGLGTAESNRRTQTALDALWPHVFQLFEPLPGGEALAQAGIVPDPATLKSAWEEQVHVAVTEAGLEIPEGAAVVTGGRDEHTPHLAELLAEMQEVARANPKAEW